MKKSDWLMAAAIVVLLIGSFPVREIWGETACDVMRLTGYVLLIKYGIQKAISHRNREKT